MHLQQNHLRGLPSLVGTSVITTQQNLVEVDANGTPLGSFPQRYTNVSVRQVTTHLSLLWSFSVQSLAASW